MSVNAHREAAAKIVVLDETLEVSQRARQALAPMGIELGFAGSVQELPVALDGRPVDVVIVNLSDDISSWEVAQHIRRARFSGRVLALVDHLSHPGTAHLLQLPQAECVVRPPSAPLLDALLQDFVAGAAGLGGRPSPPSAPLPSFHGIVGRSPQMREIFSRIEKVASADVNVCISGESGTGKELIARAIHYGSARRDRPFITLDATTIPEGLMESQLFGHVRGAFTGAIDQREGVFALAHNGTLFIDELCELGLALQAKLLRVIQTREFVKVGGTKSLRANIRLVTATNKDPERAVETGTFREDLYYRIAVVMIKVPPLRERREDVPLLVEHFLKKFSTAYQKPIRGISATAMERMTSMPWPGNVRQLENFVEQAVVFADKDMLGERELFGDKQQPAPPTVGGSASAPGYEPGLPLRDVERAHILKTLERVRGNRTEAAKLLGISIRCLQYKLKYYSQHDKVNAPGTLIPDFQPNSKLSSEIWT